MGDDYTTPQGAESDLEGVLTEVEDCQLRTEDFTATTGQVLSVSGSTTDSSNYFRFRAYVNAPTSDQLFDVLTKTGPRLLKTTADGGAICNSWNTHTRIENIGIVFEHSSGTSNVKGYEFAASDPQIIGCYFHTDHGNNDTFAIHSASSGGGILVNNVIEGEGAGDNSDDGNNGFTRGINLAGGTGHYVANNTIFRIFDRFKGQGMLFSGASAGEVYNNVVMGCRVDFADTSSGIVTEDYNCSDDGTGFINTNDVTEDISGTLEDAAFRVLESSSNRYDFNADETIDRNDSGGSFIADGFTDGMTITVAGNTENNGNHVIDTVAAGVLTLDGLTALTAATDHIALVRKSGIQDIRLASGASAISGDDRSADAEHPDVDITGATMSNWHMGAFDSLAITTEAVDVSITSDFKVQPGADVSVTSDFTLQQTADLSVESDFKLQQSSDAELTSLFVLTGATDVEIDAEFKVLASADVSTTSEFRMGGINADTSVSSDFALQSSADVSLTSDFSIASAIVVTISDNTSDLTLGGKLFNGATVVFSYTLTGHSGDEFLDTRADWSCPTAAKTESKCIAQCEMTFDTSGTHTVTVNITDSAGDTVTETHDVTTESMTDETNYTEIYVDSSVVGPGDGSSGDPYSDIDDMITDVVADTTDHIDVFLKAGETYTPTSRIDPPSGRSTLMTRFNTYGGDGYAAIDATGLGDRSNGFFHWSNCESLRVRNIEFYQGYNFIGATLDSDGVDCYFIYCAVSGNIQARDCFVHNCCGFIATGGFGDGARTTGLSAIDCMAWEMEDLGMPVAVENYVMRGCTIGFTKEDVLTRYYNCQYGTIYENKLMHSAAWNDFSQQLIKMQGGEDGLGNDCHHVIISDNLLVGAARTIEHRGTIPDPDENQRDLIVQRNYIVGDVIGTHDNSANKHQTSTLIESHGSKTAIRDNYAYFPQLDNATARFIQFRDLTSSSSSYISPANLRVYNNTAVYDCPGQQPRFIEYSNSGHGYSDAGEPDNGFFRGNVELVIDSATGPSGVMIYIGDTFTGQTYDIGELRMDYNHLYAPGFNDSGSRWARDEDGTYTRSTWDTQSGSDNHDQNSTETVTGTYSETYMYTKPTPRWRFCIDDGEDLEDGETIKSLGQQYVTVASSTGATHGMVLDIDGGTANGTVILIVGTFMVVSCDDPIDDMSLSVIIEDNATSGATYSSTITAASTAAGTIHRADHTWVEIEDWDLQDKVLATFGKLQQTSGTNAGTTVTIADVTPSTPPFYPVFDDFLPSASTNLDTYSASADDADSTTIDPSIFLDIKLGERPATNTQGAVEPPYSVLLLSTFAISSSGATAVDVSLTADFTLQQSADMTLTSAFRLGNVADLSIESEFKLQRAEDLTVTSTFAIQPVGDVTLTSTFELQQVTDTTLTSTFSLLPAVDVSITSTFHIVGQEMGVDLSIRSTFRIFNIRHEIDSMRKLLDILWRDRRG